MVNLVRTEQSACWKQTAAASRLLPAVIDRLVGCFFAFFFPFLYLIRLVTKSNFNQIVLVLRLNKTLMFSAKTIN